MTRYKPKWHTGVFAVLAAVLLCATFAAFFHTLHITFHSVPHSFDEKIVGYSNRERNCTCDNPASRIPRQEGCSDGTSSLKLANDVASQLKQKFSNLPRKKDIRPGSNVFLTFTNGHYSDLMLNAAALVADLGHPIIILTFDNASVETCIQYDLPYMRSEQQLEPGDFRQDRSKFLLMGAQKPKAVVKLFDTLQVATVALIDTDTIWLRDPFPWLDNHFDADMYVTTDCLSHEMEVNETVNVPRCGHITGNLGSGWALNTGVTIWRNRPGTRAFAADWNRYMEHNELHEQGVDDQLSFNTLMNSRDLNRRTKSYPLRRVVNDSRVFYAAPNDAVKLMVLPSAVFAGGKTMFYSHLPQKYGIQPFVVHATFQRYNNNGKRSRFREAMAYLLDPPSYYNDGAFITYDNLVLEFMEAMESLVVGTFTLIHKQVIAATYQLAVFRDAAAMARVLNRTLILPKVYAWCDTDNSPTIMRDCHFDGAEMHLPFQAPGDLYFNMDVLEDGSNFLRWREYSFLDNRNTPMQLRWSTESIFILTPDQTSPSLYATGRATHSVNETGLRSVTSALKDVRVLRLQNLHPGGFTGFESVGDNYKFNEWFARMMNDLKWCCSTQISWLKQQGLDALFYKIPIALDRTQQAATWQVPQFTKPRYCSNETTLAEIRSEWSKPLSYPMHPCNFLNEPPKVPSWGAAIWDAMRQIRDRNRMRELL